MAIQDEADSGFFSRWSRRKVQVQQGLVPVEPVEPLVLPVSPLGDARGATASQALTDAVTRPSRAPDDSSRPPPQTPTAPALVESPPPPPTLADAAALTPESDFSRFVTPGVDAGVKNAALKKLFTDPHFNVMDGLDTYIDDYGKPDPLPASLLRQMTQSKFLGLFADDEAVPAAADAASVPSPGAPDASTPPHFTPDLISTRHDNADLRLQPHPAAGPAGPGPGAEPDTGRQR